MNKLSPSLLSADFTHLAEAVEVMEKTMYLIYTLMLWTVYLYLIFQ